jgi:cyclophilin family peptidyl-prolyl cis-trans isomerase
MANHGHWTNGSQLYATRVLRGVPSLMLRPLSFITFRATPHLDHKHTVFGRVVGACLTLRLPSTRLMRHQAGKKCSTSSRRSRRTRRPIARHDRSG